MSKDIILCVDDEPIILRACSIAVAEAGFRAAVAENGVAGLEAFIRLRNEVCLVLADIVMPGINGVDMCAKILEIEPDTKLLLMTGYSHEIIELTCTKIFPFL